MEGQRGQEVKRGEKERCTNGKFEGAKVKLLKQMLKGGAPPSTSLHHSSLVGGVLLFPACSKNKNSAAITPRHTQTPRLRVPSAQVHPSRDRGYVPGQSDTRKETVAMQKFEENTPTKTSTMPGFPVTTLRAPATERLPNTDLPCSPRFECPPPYCLSVGTPTGGRATRHREVAHLTLISSRLTPLPLSPHPPTHHLFQM